MTALPGIAAALSLTLAFAPSAAAPPRAGVLELVFSDGFVDGDVLGWSSAVGVAEGQVCEQATSSCLDPMLCCYPCGIPDCEHVCTQPDGGSCPIFP